MAQKPGQTVLLLIAFNLAFILMLGARGKPASRGDAARGERDLAIGVIKEVHCKGRRLDMNLQTPREMLHLYTSNYFNVEFTAENFTLSGKLNPCRETQGLHARAVFYDIPGHPNEGELISVDLSK